MRDLHAELPAGPGGERIGRRRRLGEHRGRDRKEKRRDCEDRFQDLHAFIFAV